MGEREREGEGEGEREGGREGEREGGREGGREGRREGQWERCVDGREQIVRVYPAKTCHSLQHVCTHTHTYTYTLPSCHFDAPYKHTSSQFPVPTTYAYQMNCSMNDNHVVL